jgi:hypothetical protein
VETRAHEGGIVGGFKQWLSSGAAAVANGVARGAEWLHEEGKKLFASMPRPCRG